MFVLALGLVACTKSGPSPLRIQLTSEPATLDYSLAEDGLSFRVLSATMVGLVAYDHDYQVKPAMAEKFEVLDHGRRLQFSIKPWKWDDGKPVTASDYVYAMRRTLDPGVPAKLADLLFFVKGARAYKKGELKDFSKVGVKAVSDSLLEFELEAPVSFFPHVLTLSVGLPQREDKPQASTGPYRISKWIHNQRIELERNPYYREWEAQAPHSIVFQIIPEESTAVELFEGGRLDLLFKVPSLDLPRLRQKKQVLDFPYFATFYLAFDQKQKPWKDKKARLAVAEAIDRKAIVDAMGTGEPVATSWIPRGFPGANPDLGLAFNPSEARTNWMHSEGKLVSKLIAGYDSGHRNTTIMERVQHDLKTNLGVSLELKTRDWKTYLRELNTSTPPIYRFGWLAPFSDAYADLMLFQSQSPNNYTGWKSAKYDSFLERIAQLDAKSPERQKLIDEAQRLLLEQEVVVVPIFHYIQSVLVSPRVQNVWVSGTGTMEYHKLKISN